MRTDFSDKMSSCVLDVVDDFSPHVIGSLYFLNLSDLFSTFLFPNSFCTSRSNSKATLSIIYFLIFSIKITFPFLDISKHPSMLLSFILYDIYNFLILSQLTILGALAPILDCEHPGEQESCWSHNYFL